MSRIEGVHCNTNISIVHIPYTVYSNNKFTLILLLIPHSRLIVVLVMVSKVSPCLTTSSSPSAAEPSCSTGAYGRTQWAESYRTSFHSLLRPIPMPSLILIPPQKWIRRALCCPWLLTHQLLPQGMGKIYSAWWNMISCIDTSTELNCTAYNIIIIIIMGMVCTCKHVL